MKVETIQEAIEGAPSVILADGDGGVTFHLVTDEALLSAARSVCDDNEWTEDEAQGLYAAIIRTFEVLAALGEGET